MAHIAHTRSLLSGLHVPDGFALHNVADGVIITGDQASTAVSWMVLELDGGRWYVSSWQAHDPESGPAVEAVVLPDAQSARQWFVDHWGTADAQPSGPPDPR